jgi:hypothetical protein
VGGVCSVTYSGVRFGAACAAEPASMVSDAAAAARLRRFMTTCRFRDIAKRLPNT